jgi:hypothetical protein
MNRALAAFSLNVILAATASAQPADPDPALNEPDKLAWELFVLVSRPAASPGGNNSVFETWAQNGDTFTANPKFPGASGPPSCGQQLVAAVTPVATPTVLNVPALEALAPRPPGLQPRVVPGGTEDQPSEEVRRNVANDGKVHVDYPASSPYVLGCGGTSVTLAADGDSIAEEVVWNDRGARGTGGGISEFYAVPDFQSGTPLPASPSDGRRGRGVPDVAAAAAETNGYRIFVDGSEVVASGTSAVAPLWGAFIALLNEQRGTPLGFVNSQLYQATGLLRPVTTGDNKDSNGDLGYPAGPGWSACTGLGTPKGAEITAAFTAVA